MYSDGFAFSGFSSKGFSKFDITKSGIPVVQTGTGGVEGADQDFCTALGNLAFASSDHAGGSGLIPHQAGPDAMGPSVNMVVPKDSAVKQPLTSRVGLTFTDLLDKASLTAANFTVRPLGGAALAGTIATQTGILNFSPASPLLPNTTYEVIVNAGGIKDYAGNGVPKAFRSVFSTGTEISTGLSALPRKAGAKAPIRLGVRPLDRLERNGMAADETAGRWVDIQGRVLPVGEASPGASPEEVPDATPDAADARAR
jgi:hypothetical protein